MYTFLGLKINAGTRQMLLNSLRPQKAGYTLVFWLTTGSNVILNTVCLAHWSLYDSQTESCRYWLRKAVSTSKTFSRNRRTSYSVVWTELCSIKNTGLWVRENQFPDPTLLLVGYVTLDKSLKHCEDHKIKITILALNISQGYYQNQIRQCLKVPWILITLYKLKLNESSHFTKPQLQVMLDCRE